MLRADLQPGAHVQEVRHTLVIQQDVDGHGATAGRVHQVLQDLDVREHVHHDRYHLQEWAVLFERGQRCVVCRDRNNAGELVSAL